MKRISIHIHIYIRMCLCCVFFFSNNKMKMSIKSTCWTLKFRFNKRANKLVWGLTVSLLLLDQQLIMHWTTFRNKRFESGKKRFKHKSVEGIEKNCRGKKTKVKSKNKKEKSMWRMLIEMSTCHTMNRTTSVSCSSHTPADRKTSVECSLNLN